MKSRYVWLLSPLVILLGVWAINTFYVSVHPAYTYLLGFVVGIGIVLKLQELED